MLTYGDGVANMDIGELVAFHREHGKHATVTAVRPPARFGGYGMEDEPGAPTSRRNPRVTAGSTRASSFSTRGCSTTFGETRRCSSGSRWNTCPGKASCVAYKHLGFWQPMDTLRDKNYLDGLWQQGRPPGRCGTEWLRRASRWIGRSGRQAGLPHRAHRFQGFVAWLWLQALGAEVTGYALEPPTEPSLFELCGDRPRPIRSIVGDVRDLEHLKRAIAEARPEIVIHMAAQALVRESYKEPVETYAINVMGTVNLLEAVRAVRGERRAQCNHRQGATRTGSGLGIPGERTARRARPLLQQQGVLGTGDVSVQGLLLQPRRCVTPRRGGRFGPSRERASAVATGRRTGWCRTSSGRCSTRNLSCSGARPRYGRGSTCSSRSAATCRRAEAL